MLAARFSDFRIEAGCDEAGRGCLAGPVFAAAVVFPPDYRNEALERVTPCGKKSCTMR